MTEQTNDFYLDVFMFDNQRIGKIVYHSAKHKYGSYDQMAVGYVSFVSNFTNEEEWDEFLRKIRACSVLPDDIDALRRAYEDAKYKICREICNLAGGAENLWSSWRRI